MSIDFYSNIELLLVLIAMRNIFARRELAGAYFCAAGFGFLAFVLWGGILSGVFQLAAFGIPGVCALHFLGDEGYAEMPDNLANAKIPPKVNGEAVAHKNKLTAILLAVFVGVLSVDRFYLGYTGLGVAKLLTGGGCGIWVLIDLIMICTGSLRPGDFFCRQQPAGGGKALRQNKTAPCKASACKGLDVPQGYTP